MSDKIEGTMNLEGLIEGPMPPFPDAQAKLEKWAEGFAGGAVRVSVQVDGAHFSALPSNAPVRVSALAKAGEEPAHVVADALADLLRYFPPLERGQVFSTLRSVEYRPGQEVQTVYAVGPDGRAATRQQVVACQTVSAQEPVSRREMLKQGLIGLGVAVVVLAISSYWVDYRGIWRRMTARVEPTAVTVDMGTFGPYLQVKVTGLDRRDGTLEVELARGKNYPRTEAAWDTLYGSPPEVLLPTATGPASTAAGSAPAATAPAGMPASLLRRRLALASLAKGVVVLEFRDSKGQLLGQTLLRVADLQLNEKVNGAVPAPVVDKRAVAPATVRVLPE
jgi:hypothetical protein